MNKKFNPQHRAFYIQRRDAIRRGIAFKLTYKEWISIWQKSGHLHERGNHKGQYVMSRPGDKGAYEVGNVRIITTGENTSEWCKGRPLSQEHRAKIATTKQGQSLSNEHRHKISKGLEGRPVSKETREKISKAQKGSKKSEEHKRKISEAKRGVPWSNARRQAQLDQH